MELLKNLEGLSADEQMTAVVELQKAAMKHLEEQKQASIGKSAELVIQGLKKIKSDFEAKFDSLNYDIQTKVASLKDGEQGLQGPKGDQGDRGLDGANGRDGRDGKDGKDGLDGVDGVGVRDAKIDFDGSLVISLTDGREINCGEVVSVDVAKQIQKVTHNIQTGAGGDSQTVLDAIAALQATIATYGTMATQNANNVAITGGAINNTTIGATTPSTGVFTTLTATGQTSLGGAAGAEGLRVIPSTTGRYLVARGSSGNPDFGASGGTLILYGGANSGIAFYSNGYTQAQFNVAHTASAVNYVQVTGAATGGIPRISTQGSDSAASLAVTAKSGTIWLETASGFGMVGVNHTAGANNYLALTGGANNPPVISAASGFNSNVPLLFQSKGTGAIDLAAGSSGVNISNGGTVTAITRTAIGSNYTSALTGVVSAPTTAGGVQATVNTFIYANTATIGSGGTGYTLNDVLTVVGGTAQTIAATFTVTGVSGGVITSVSSLNFASYLIPPTNPASVTGGTGSGATLNILYGFAGCVITNAGSGYVEQPTVTFSGGGGSGAAAYATVGTTAIVRSLGTNLDFYTPGGAGFRVGDNGTTNAAYWSAFGGPTAPVLRAVTTASGIFQTSGAYPLVFQTNFGTEQLRVSHTASAVNYVQVTGAATGSATGLAVSAQGSDASINLNVNPKGSGYVQFDSGKANYLVLRGASAGSAPIFGLVGSDTNIPLVLQPKGTGALQAQQTDSTATGGNARGANAVDWQTSRGNAANVASSSFAVVAGGTSNTGSGFGGAVVGGNSNTSSSSYVFIGAGRYNVSSGPLSSVVGGETNSATGYHNFIGGGFKNSGTANAAVTTQSATMNGTTAVTLSGSNASIKVGQQITGTSIQSDPPTYVAAISGTSLTLSQAASGSSTSTLSFYTPHGVVVGGGNNQATGSYSFIGGGGDAGTAANRNVASGDWSVVGGGRGNQATGSGAVIVGGGFDGTTLGANTASGSASAVLSGFSNNATGNYSSVLSGINSTSSGNHSSVIGAYGTSRSIVGTTVITGSNNAYGTQTQGGSQTAILVLARQTTDATPTVLASNSATGNTQNQVILPNNSAYYFRGEVVSGVTGGGNTKGWYIEGVIKRGANAASTALVGTPTVTSNYADAGASTWTIAVTADTTNGGLAVTFTGQAATTIRTVAQIRTTEMTY